MTVQPNAQSKISQMPSPAIHVKDIGSGKMSARVMFDSAGEVIEVETGNYLNAAREMLHRRWPGIEFQKIGWSANAREAIYHFRAQAVQP